jgi:hypothetical protein
MTCSLDTGTRRSNTADVLRRVGNVLVLLAFLMAIGAHWFVLQSVAWTTMLADNLRSASFQQAVQRTFDGKHPCSLCEQISKSKQSEKKSEFQLEPNKFEFSYAPCAFIFVAPQQFQELRVSDCVGNSLAHAPPAPPPRQLLS